MYLMATLRKPAAWTAALEWINRILIGVFAAVPARRFENSGPSPPTKARDMATSFALTKGGDDDQEPLVGEKQVDAKEVHITRRLWG